MSNLRTYELAKEFYWMVLELRLPPELSGQLRRAAVSIINNTQEGAARRTAPDRRRFYDMAFGSAKESMAILETGRVTSAKLLDRADHLAACLYKLSRSRD